MTIRRITIRVPDVLHSELEACASAENVSLNTLAMRALETYMQERAVQAGRWPVAELGALLAPAAVANDIDEGNLLAHARRVREQIWRERYADAVGTLTAEHTPV